MNKDEKCIFSGLDGFCSALVGTACYGNNTSCSFYKTLEQYTVERNRAIMINRKKGNCERCQYVNVKCEITPIKPKI